MGICFSSSSVNRPQYSASPSTHNSDGKRFLPLPPPDARTLKWPNLVVFSFEDLKYATRNFKSDTLIGEGGFGRVYKGWLDENTLTPTKPGSGIVVAIKRLSKKSSQGFQEWQNYNAKLSDFGLARLGPSEGNTHVSTRIMGTYGYAAPEYIATGNLYVKSDVYGFGVVLLEILTGMRALDPERPSGQQILVEWTKPCLSSKKKLKTIMDGRIEGQYSLEAAFEAAQLTLKCLQSDPHLRPSMEEVLEELEAIQLVHNPQLSPSPFS